LKLEWLETRDSPAVSALALPALKFDVANHALSILAPARPIDVELSAGANSTISLKVDGQVHSSDPASLHFDPTLAALPANSIRQVALTGGGTQNQLIISHWSSSDGLSLISDGAITFRDQVSAVGTLQVSAVQLTLSGSVRAGSATLATSGIVNVTAGGTLTVASGPLFVSADYFVNVGRVQADAARGGAVVIHTRGYLSGGTMTASGSSSSGGSIEIDFRESYTETVSATTTANSIHGPGGHITLLGGRNARLLTSGRIEARGSAGGVIDLLGDTVVLAGTQIDASGYAGSGGQIRVGGDFQGANPAFLNAHIVSISDSTTIAANGTSAGGRVIVWSMSQTDFAGAIDARTIHGKAGFIEVSSHQTLNFNGTADPGLGGTLLLDPKNLIVDASKGRFPQYALVGQSAGSSGYLVPTILDNGNIIVDEPYANQSAGAIYLFHGQTGSLISMLTGTSSSSKGHSSILVLANGNYVISSPDWNNRRGAATWANGAVGVTGVISSDNSLVGSNSGDLGIVPGQAPAIGLPDGNYVVVSPGWNNNRGAVSWADGASGLSGVVSATNSLVGSTGGTFTPNGILIGGDQVGSRVAVLANGNLVIGSSAWSNQTGAITWMNSSVGLTGTVSSANSMTGHSPGDMFGSGILRLPNGNFLVHSRALGGAVTWVDGSKAATGTLSTANSLIDTGFAETLALPNGNYLVTNTSWNGGRGFVAWGDGSRGLAGPVSEFNSLVGSATDSAGILGDRVGTVTLLENGNYVVASPHWAGDTGAVTWGNGSAGVKGSVSASNSLVGSRPGDRVSAGTDYAAGGIVSLTNGNYVIASPLWNQASGAVTWGDGLHGTVGVVSETNSLVGDRNDYVGGYSSKPGASIVPLANGNYVVASPYWQNWHGAVTWGDGTRGVSGHVSSANSLVGNVGGSVFEGPAGLFFAGGDLLGSGGVTGVTALPDGNYLIASPQWNFGRGAATVGNGLGGSVGFISASNSLVGDTPWTATELWPLSGGDRVSAGGVVALANGNFVVASPQWNQGRGAATWIDRSDLLYAVVSEFNSLVGVKPGELDSYGYSYAGGDLIGSAASSGPGKLGVVPLTNGNYLVTSKNWSTWADGSLGVSGIVSVGKSIASAPGSYFLGAGALPDGNARLYLIFGPNQTLPYPGMATTWIEGRSGATLSGESIISSHNTTNTAIGVVLNGPIPGSFVSNLHTALFVNITDVNQLMFSLAQTQSLTIAPDFIARTLNSGISVVLQASNDIILNSPILVTPNGSSGNLTLQAGRSIVLNAPIDTAGGNLTLLANAARADGVIDSQREPGDAVIVMNAGASLDTGSGSLNLSIAAGADKTNHSVGGITMLGLTSGLTSIASGNQLEFLISGSTPGDGSSAGTYTQAVIEGALTLTGLRLDLVQTFASTPGSKFTLIRTSDGVTGTLVNLPEGALVSSSSKIQFRISYQANGGKDVVLTQVSEAPKLAAIDPPLGTLLVGARLNLQVEVQKSTGQVIGDYKGTASVVQSSGPQDGIDLGASAVTVENGIATFRGLTLRRPGYFLLRISASGASDVVVAVEAVSNASQRYVVAVYYDLLGRHPDTGGLNYWVDQLQSGIDRQSVANNLASSDEFFATVVRPAYRKFLGREADEEGLAYWTEQLQTGLRDEELEANFIAAPEFYARFGGTASDWVVAMYRHLLFRQPDQEGVAYWTNQLADDVDRYAVALGFAASEERKSNYLIDIYQKYLGRLAQANETEYWLQHFKDGGTKEEIIAQFIGSDEYFDLHSSEPLTL
jgi:hypothetical protein